MKKARNINDVPVEIWMEVASHLPHKELWRIRESLNSAFYKASKITVQRLFSGLTPNPIPKLIFSITRECNDNISKFILVPDPNAGAEAQTSSFVSFVPLEKGFQGLGKIINRISDKLSKDVSVGAFNRSSIDGNRDTDPNKEEMMTEFPRSEFRKLSNFFRTKWEDYKKYLPGSVQSAYSILFSHIMNTLETLCNRPQNTMDVGLQMSVLAQTWRVIDILSAPSYKDPRSDCDCDGGCGDFAFSHMLFTLEREFGDGEENRNPVEFRTDDYIRNSPEVDWIWGKSAAKMKGVSQSFDDGHSTFDLQAIWHGEEGNQLSIIDVGLSIPISILLI